MIQGHHGRAMAALESPPASTSADASGHDRQALVQGQVTFQVFSKAQTGTSEVPYLSGWPALGVCEGRDGRFQEGLSTL